MKVFVDTNVLVSAVATRGLCADVLREVLAAHDLVISRQVLDEVRRVLQTKFGATQDVITDFIRLLQQDAILARTSRVPEVELRDRADRLILGAAVASGADVLVTGDNELRELGALEGVEIISPRQFWTKLRLRPQSTDR
jgi:putative PIN family toxin of toxin-antitoxin system